MKLKLSEKQIQNQCLDYALRVPGLELWQVNTVGVFDKAINSYRMPKSPYRIKGISDIIGFYKKRSLYFEFKTPPRRKCLSPEQKEFRDIALQNGQDFRIITSFEEFLDAIES